MEFNRRDFLKSAGLASVAGATACTIDPQTPVENYLPYVRPPEDVLPGTASYVSTACGECASGCGMVARIKEGRVVMVEGNPDYTEGRGLCTRGHFGLIGAYGPDRVTGPTHEGKTHSWDDALAKVSAAVKAAQAAGKSVAWLGQYRTGSLGSLLGEFAGATALRRVHWEALGIESQLAATRTAFGIGALPTYDLSGAHVILSFGLDFLGTAYGGMGMSQGWAKAKNPSNGFVTRFVAIEPHISITSSQADNFLPPTPGTELAAALAIAKLAADKVGYANASLLAGVDVAAMSAACGLSVEKLTEVAGWITSHASVILPGGYANAGTQATDLAVVAYLLNDICGNIGRSVLFGKEQHYGLVSSYADVQALMDDAKAGKIGVLFIDGVNPVYSLPGGVTEALDAVDLLVQFANEADDSSRPKTLMLPPGSSLEGWGDANVTTGVSTLQQAAMTPLHDSKTVGDVLLALVKGMALAAPVVEAAAGLAGEAAPMVAPLLYTAADFRTYVEARWRRDVWDQTGTFESFWVKARQRGGYFAPASGAAAPLTLASLPSFAAASAGSDMALVLFPSNNLGDGRHANRPWAQELPDPISTSTWGTWAELHPKTVAKLGLAKSDSVKVKTASGEITVGYFATPGVREDTVAVVHGNGHENSGRFGTGRGANPVRLLTHSSDPTSGAFASYGARATVTRSAETSDFFALSGNIDQDGRPIALAISAEAAAAQPTGETGALIRLHTIPWDRRLQERGIHDMFPEPQHPTYRFAMAIDLNSCNGCNACTIACNIENNIPFVGPDQTRRGRGMSWIRMNRFIEGEGEHVDVRHMPSLCQHCSHAPCEGVCPVLATYHNLDGLNAMIYNRCVGTRYCANNCPYTARRFNYHTWTWPDSMYLMLNPDVSVREMGVMEKCTFCIQRTRAAKDEWRDVHETVPDKALVNLTACASACPSDCITFGNLKDPEATVQKHFASPRTYTLLGELNTKPGIRYLAKTRHHLSDDGGGHGAGHGGAQGGGKHDAGSATEHTAPAAPGQPDPAAPAGDHAGHGHTEPTAPAAGH